jgi:hypothetical protein
MQCNAMQCNVCMEVRPSVWMKSVSHFFFFFFHFLQKTQNLVEACGFELRTSRKWKSECTDDGRTEWSHFIYLAKWKYQCKNVSMCECHGWTDKFQLFQFSFSSVAYSQVSLSVRTEVRSQKKRYGQTQTNRNTDPIGGNTFNGKNLFLNLLNVTDGTIQEQTCRTINITFSQYAMQCNAMQCNTMQCNAMQCNAINAMHVSMHAMHNAMYVRKSVRPYGMKSQSFFFFFSFF